MSFEDKNIFDLKNNNENNSRDDSTIGKNTYKNKLKKRKKKFLANVKGYGKSGNYGKGSRLEGEDWNYFTNIMDNIRLGFDSLDEKVSMANNVFDQTIDREIYISSNQIACTIIEKLLPFTSPEHIERFQNTFSKNFRPICSDRFASHVLQKLIEISFLRGVSQIQTITETEIKQENDDESEITDDGQTQSKQKKLSPIIDDEKEYNLRAEFTQEHIENCCEFLLKISKFLLNNLEDFVWDTYATYLIRICLLSLCGVFVYKTKDFLTCATDIRQKSGLNMGSVQIEKISPLNVPDNWKGIINEYAIRLQSWPQFKDFAYDELSSALLQNLCLALRHTNKSTLKHMGKQILNEGFLQSYTPDEADSDNKSNLPAVFSTQPSIHLLEKLMTVAGRKLMTQFYVKLFSGNLTVISNLKTGNFTVQKLLENIKTKDEFEKIFDELIDNVENLLKIGHTGVVNALTQCCLRLSTKQGALITCLQKVFQCKTPQEFDKIILSILMLKPYSTVKSNESSNIYIHLHGSLILQALLKFNKPIKFVQSILAQTPQQLCEIFCNPRGSHVCDAFLTSQFIGEKSRERLIKHMMGYYIEMAISKHGSRAIEAIFNSAGDSERTRIVKELSQTINQLNSTPSGRLINFKFRIETYRVTPAQWKSTFSKESKSEKLFKDIIN